MGTHNSRGILATNGKAYNMNSATTAPKATTTTGNFIDPYALGISEFTVKLHRGQAMAKRALEVAVLCDQRVRSALLRCGGARSAR